MWSAEGPLKRKVQLSVFNLSFIVVSIHSEKKLKRETVLGCITKHAQNGLCEQMPKMWSHILSREKQHNEMLFSSLVELNSWSFRTKQTSQSLTSKWTCENLNSMHLYTVVAIILRTLEFSSGFFFKSVISIFCCSVSVSNISLHFQTYIFPLIVMIQWDFCLTTASAPHRDLITSPSSSSSSSSSLSGMTWSSRTNWHRLNPEEL